LSTRTQVGTAKQNSTAVYNLLTLPSDILSQVAKFLTISDVLHAVTVCKDWQDCFFPLKQFNPTEFFSEEIRGMWKILTNRAYNCEHRFSDSLGPPATFEEILETEEHIGMKFPTDLRQFFLLHRGQQKEGETLVGEFRVLSLCGVEECVNFFKKSFRRQRKEDKRR